MLGPVGIRDKVQAFSCVPFFEYYRRIASFYPRHLRGVVVLRCTAWTVPLVTGQMRRRVLGLSDRDALKRCHQVAGKVLAHTEDTIIGLRNAVEALGAGLKGQLA